MAGGNRAAVAADSRSLTRRHHESKLIVPINPIDILYQSGCRELLEEGSHGRTAAPFDTCSSTR
jgi:hypothetical protein